MASASSSNPEDLVRTLSRLVFACTAPDRTTLRLFDPATGQLANYLLVKVLDDSGDLHGRSPGRDASLGSPRAILEDLTKRLKAVLREEIPAEEAHLASQSETPPPRDSQFASHPSGMKPRTVLITARTSRAAEAPTWLCPPGRVSRHRRCNGRYLVSHHTAAEGVPSAAGPALTVRPQDADTSEDDSWHSCDALDSAEGRRGLARGSEGGTVGQADSGANKVLSTVSEATAASGGHRVETQPQAAGFIAPTPPPQASPRTPLKTKMHRTPHETLPPGGIDFPPFLAASTPRAVARHRKLLAETCRTLEKNRTRRTTLPGIKSSFDLEVFDPQSVTAALAESDRRASVGVAYPSIRYGGNRRSTTT